MKINPILSHSFITRFLSVVPFVLTFFAAAASLSSQEQHRGVVRPLSDAKIEQDPDSKCLAGALENGDPNTGPSTFLLRAAPNCLVPWHYHTAEEQLIVVSGDVEAGMDGVSPRVLQAGGFAMMPGKEKHWFSCKSKDSCLMFVTFDRAYDIFWVK